MRETAGRIMRLVFGLGASNGQPFEEIFAKHINNSLACAQELTALCAADTPEAMFAHRERMLEYEHANDQLKRAVDSQLHETYITRLEQEDVEKIIENLERITNGMRTVVKNLAVFHIMVLRQDFTHFAEIIHDAIDILATTIAKMPRLSRKDAHAAETRIGVLEKRADHLLLDAIGRLYADEADAKVFVAWFVVFQEMENISNTCHYTAEFLDAVTRKMSY